MYLFFILMEYMPQSDNAYDTMNWVSRVLGGVFWI